MIKARGEHGAVKSNPPVFLPKERLKRGDVAVSDQAFRMIQLLLCQKIEKIRGTETASERNQPRDPIIVERVAEAIQPLLGRTREVARREKLVRRNDFEAEALQFDCSELDAAKV